MKTPKLPHFFIILILLITISFSSSVLSVYTSPSLNITVNTNQQYYSLRQLVDIEGTLTRNGENVSNRLVAVEVDAPGPRSILVRTVDTGTLLPPQHVWVDKITPCRDQWGQEETDRFKAGKDPAYFKITVVSAITAEEVRVFLTFYDSNNVLLGYSPQGVTNFGPGTWEPVISTAIPSWASTGTAIAYASVCTGYPRVGGTPYSPETSQTFTITNGAGIGGGGGSNSNPTFAGSSQTEGTYNLAFKLPPELAAGLRLGEHTVYASAKYNEWEKATADTTFQVMSTSYPPQASFCYYVAGSPTPDKPYPGGTTTFDASASSPEGPPDDYITSYWFDFGDNTNSTSTGQNTANAKQNHVYASAGTYIVTLNVTDSEGLWSTTSKPVTVYPTYGPTADFTYSPPQPFTGGLTTFDASPSTRGWSGLRYPPIIQYEWDYGDNTPLDIKTGEGNYTATHIYTDPDNYTVTLKVIDDEAGWDTISKDIEVINVTGVHDVAIPNVMLKPSTPEACSPPCGRLGVYKSWIVSINVTVTNNGTLSETFDVTAYYDSTLIGTETVTNLAPLESRNVFFTWDTTTLTTGNYVIKANATLVLGDINPTNNVFLVDVKLKIMGDVDGSGVVDSTDDGLMGLAWQSILGETLYNPNCDFNYDGTVDSSDDGTFGLHWGEVG